MKTGTLFSWSSGYEALACITDPERKWRPTTDLITLVPTQLGKVHCSR